MDFNDIQKLLDTVVGGQSFREMTAISFNQYVLGKVNGLKTYDPRIQEIVMSCNTFTLSRTMSDEVKLEKLKKLSDMGIEIP